jgi:hypothetical protein
VTNAAGYPDFFIVGAPRSGTTAMFDYLAEHPSIYAAPTKEPQLFATDLDGGTYLESVTFMRDRDRYLAMFADARPDQLAGEGSTWYLYSKVAATAIHEAVPDARIIAMLRDPVRMLHSLHGRRFYAGSEDIPRFEDALAAEEDRRAGRRIPERARNVKALQYHAVGSYAEQLQRYFDVFGRNRVHVIIFEDFVRDVPGAYRGVLEFLGVDPDFAPDFRVINAGASRRSQRVQQALLSPRVIRAARWVVPTRARPAVGRMWDRLNSRPEKRAPLDPAVATRLREELLPDIQRTGELLGRDLTKVWR